MCDRAGNSNCSEPYFIVQFVSSALCRYCIHNIINHSVVSNSVHVIDPFIVVQRYRVGKNAGRHRGPAR